MTGTLKQTTQKVTTVVYFSGIIFAFLSFLSTTFQWKVLRNELV